MLGDSFQTILKDSLVRQSEQINKKITEHENEKLKESKPVECINNNIMFKLKRERKLK